MLVFKNKWLCSHTSTVPSRRLRNRNRIPDFWLHPRSSRRKSAGPGRTIELLESANVCDSGVRPRQLICRCRRRTPRRVRVAPIFPCDHCATVPEPSATRPPDLVERPGSTRRGISPTSRRRLVPGSGGFHRPSTRPSSTLLIVPIDPTHKIWLVRISPGLVQIVNRFTVLASSHLTSSWRCLRSRRG